MNKAARRAIENQISYLEDNMYRHKHFTNTPDWDVIREHEEEIKELKRALEESS